MNKEKLIEGAKEATKLSYSPYSHFAVGAAILMNDGTLIKGANIENASYGLSMCAERNTVFQAVLKGYKKEQMLGLAIAVDADEVPYPCGACRQVLSELFPMDAPIYVVNFNGKVLETNLKELLPYTFEPSNLE